MNSVLILAGGKSERMHFPKPYLSWNGKTFLRTIIDEYCSAGITNICVVLNKAFCTGKWAEFLDEVKLKANIIENPFPEFGRFYSIKLGIKDLMNSEYCFIHNVDNPFVSKETIEDLLDSRNLEGYTSPTFGGKNGHPVLVSKVIMKYINDYHDENHKLNDILSRFPQKKVECNGEILMNINTPEEFQLCLSNSVDK